MSRRTFAEYKAAVTHALGGEPAAGFTTAQIVNDALLHLGSMYSWKWRRGGPVTLSLTADQPYVELPLDFGELESLTYPGSVQKAMIPTTMSQIQQLRASESTPVGYIFYYAINTGESDAAYPELGLGLSLIELYPTPRADEPGALTIVYRRDLPKLVNDDDIPMIPEWMDWALVLLCRAKAHIIEDDDPNSASMVAFDKEITNHFQRDSMSQRRLGVMRGGLHSNVDGADPRYPSSIGDPSQA